MKKVKKKLNLGSGNDYMAGWINIDVDPSCKKDLVADLQKPFPFGSDSVDEIKAFDILEHFTKEDGEIFLRECYRVLKLGGIITIRTHSVFQIFDFFRKDPQLLIHFLYGDTKVTGIYGAHKYAYTEGSIKYLLKKIGFSISSLKVDQTNLVIVAKKNKFSQKLLRIGIITSKTSSSEVLNSIRSQGNIRISTYKYPFYFNNILLISFALYPYLSLLLRLKKENIDILVVSGFFEKIFFTYLSHFFRFRTIWFEDNDYQKAVRNNAFMPKVLYRLTNNFPLRVIETTKKSAANFTAYTKVPSSKVIVIPEKLGSRSSIKKYTNDVFTLLSDCQYD